MLRQDLLEAGEASALVGAILWLAQTILETLQPGDLDAWLHRVGLADAIGELVSEVERTETVVNGVGGRAVGNKPLARSLVRVKELMYDADDVVDELDYCRLQQQVQGVMLAPAVDLESMFRDGAEQVDTSANTVVMLAPATEPEGMIGHEDSDGAEQVNTSSNTVRKNRSKEWDYFHKLPPPPADGEPRKAECIDCRKQLTLGHGTSVLRKHRNSCSKKRSAIEGTPNRPRPSADHNVLRDGATISTNDAEGRKRMRTEYNEAWDKAGFLKRIQEIVLELRRIRGDVIEYLKDSIARSDQYQTDNSDTQVRTSSSLPGKVYGRNVEKNNIIKAIKAAKSDNITVLPIVGVLGVGKTALAKLVYNDPHVERKFERIWVWVSNIFDEVRVIREILDVVTLASHEGSHNRESYEGVSNYSKLLEVLKKHMTSLSKKFLLVLDDVCDWKDNSQWGDLLDALGSSCTNGNVIIVTARNLSVAKRLGTVKPVELRALGNYHLWLLFKASAFSDNNYQEHQDISLQICAKLKGNPLAAKGAAKMLRDNPTIDHWKSFMKNGIVQLHGGIMTALKNIYYHLPYHVQQCFSFCSIFPIYHLFHIDDLVSMWLSVGFVRSIATGQDCFNTLVNLGFLEGKTGCSILQKKCYVMCGFMHEFARLVSGTEFAAIDGLECKEVPPTVRHFLVQTDSLYHKDACGIIVRNVKFEENLKSIVSSARRLRTLILIGNYSSLFFQYFNTFMWNPVNCIHLRYLKLEKKGSIEALPISVSKFYHLEVLDVGCQAIVHGMSDLISMRHLVLTNGTCRASSLAISAFLETLHVEDYEGWEILPSLESLSSLKKLKLRNMSEVTELLIPSLEELVLIDMPKLDRCFPSSVRNLNSSLRVLEIRRCRVLKAFPLFGSFEKFEIEQKSWLPNVSELTVHRCPHLVVSNPLPPSSRFCKLSIIEVSVLPKMEGSLDAEMVIGSSEVSERYSNGLTLDDKILSFHNLRTVTQLRIEGCRNLFSISLESLRQLVSLKSLEIWSCKNFFSSNVPSARTHEDMAATDFDALPSLERLCIIDCGITGEWLSVILQHVPVLKELNIGRCKQITGLLIEGKENSLSDVTSAPSALLGGNPYRDGALTRPCPSKLLRIPSNLIPSLKKIEIMYCELTFEGNKEDISRFTSLEKLKIAGCADLISSLVQEGEMDDQVNVRWLLPCSLGVLYIYYGFLRTLQPCFPGDLTRLKVLVVSAIYGLGSLQLHSCTALEKLTIEDCESLDTLEGFQTLRSLACLEVYRCPGLPQCLESLSMQGDEVWPELERLCIDDYSFLTMPICKHLTSLQCLHFVGPRDFAEGIDAAGLTCEQEAALQLLTSLQELRFECCCKLSDLPVGLHSLLSVKRLFIDYCPNISRLPERGLPPSLEELEVCECSNELAEQSRKLATSKVKVIVDGEYVN